MSASTRSSTPVPVELAGPVVGDDEDDVGPLDSGVEDRLGVEDHLGDREARALRDRVVVLLRRVQAAGESRPGERPCRALHTLPRGAGEDETDGPVELVREAGRLAPGRGARPPRVPPAVGGGERRAAARRGATPSS